VHDAATMANYELDVAAVGVADNAKPPLLAIGEARWNDMMGRAHIERLRQVRKVLEHNGKYDVSGTRLLLFSGAGFNDKARAAAQSGDIELIELPMLYG
jgi:uncharacterized protein